MPKIEALMQGQQSTNLIPPDQNLPYETDEESSGGVGLIIFSIVWTAIPAFMLFQAFTTEAPWFAFLVLGVFVLIGVALFLGGVSSLVSRRHWRITDSSVSCEATGLMGTSEWSEPLENYRGVLSESEYHSGGQNSSSYTIYKVILKHQDDEDRSVELYRSRSEEGFRKEQERYAKLFGLPALEETDEGIIERQADQLDKSLREQAAEGLLDVDFDPSQKPPGDNLRVRTEGDRLEMETLSGKFPAGCLMLTTLLLVGGPALALGTALGYFDIASQYIWVGGVIFLIGLASVALAVAGKVISEVLEVSPEEVKTVYRSPWGEFGEACVPADDVEEVVIKEREDSTSGTLVHIVTDKRTLDFGGSLSDAEKKWVRDCIITVVSV